MELPLKSIGNSKPPRSRPCTSRSISLANSELSIDTNTKRIKDYEYQQDSLLGQGYSSKVYLGHGLLQKDKKYAIKVVDKRRMSRQLLALLKQQIQIHRQLSHSNIIQCHDVIQKDNFYYLVLQYCPHGTLQQYIKKHQRLAQSTAVSILQQILAAYRYLLEMKVIHRDLKPPNILRTGNAWKICDFGFSIMGKKQYAGDMNVGTPAYMPPQALQKSLYSFKSDIFSLGVLTYQMLFGITPWQHKNQTLLLKMMRQNPLPQQKLNSLSNQQLAIFITKCCQMLQRRRMSPSQIEQFSFVQQEHLTPIKVKPRKTSRQRAGLELGHGKQENQQQSEHSKLQDEIGETGGSKVIQVGQLSKTASSQGSSSGVKNTSRQLNFKSNCWIIQRQIYFARLLYALMWHHKTVIFEQDRKQLFFSIFSKHAQHILRRIRHSHVNYLKLHKWQQFSNSEQFTGYHHEAQRLIKQITILADSEVRRKTIIVIRHVNRKYDQLSFDQLPKIACLVHLMDYVKDLLSTCYRQFTKKQGEKVCSDHRRILQSLIAYCGYLNNLMQTVKKQEHDKSELKDQIKEQLNERRDYKKGGNLLQQQRPRNMNVLSELIKQLGVVVA